MWNRRGQSSAEYAIVLSVVLAALVAMQVYVKRGAQGRLKIAVDQYTKAGENKLTWLDYDPTFDANDVTLKSSANTAKGQYEPYYAESDNKVVRTGATVDDVNLAGNKITRSIDQATQDETRRITTSYQKQRKIDERD